MKKAETVTDDKGNIYVVPAQMTREEAEVYFPNQPERSKREDLCYMNFLKSDGLTKTINIVETNGKRILDLT